MPTYDYECAACGKHLEHFQMMSDAPIKKCPKCGKLRLKRMIGAGAGVIFKGSGFYTTDYRSASYDTSKKGDVEPAPKSDSKSDSKSSDSKSDSNSDTSAKPAGATDSSQASPPPAPSKKSKAKK